MVKTAATLNSRPAYGGPLTSLVASGECLPCEAAHAAQEAAAAETFAADIETIGPEEAAALSGDEWDGTYPERARWEGPIGFEGEMTGDGRYIEHGALRWENLPIPLRYVSEDVGAHDGAQVAGAIDTIKRMDNGVIWGSGPLDMSSDVGREAYKTLRLQYANGVSMDLDDVTFQVHIAQALADEMMGEGEPMVASQVLTDDGRVVAATVAPDDEVTFTTDARVRAATIVDIPAFANARLTLVASGSFSYNPGQARAPKGTPIGGQWLDTPSRLREEAIRATLEHSAPFGGSGSSGLTRVVEVVSEQGGASLDPITFTQPTAGYMVAMRGHNLEVPEAEFFAEGAGEDTMYSWIEGNIDALSEPGAHIGLWHDKDNAEVVLDVSQRVDTLDEAIALGVERNQQAVWDVAAGVEIPTGGTGDRGADDGEQGPYSRRPPRGLSRLGRGAQARVRSGASGGPWSASVLTFRGNPNQARAPKGSPIGGQWISTTSGILRELAGGSAASVGDGGSLGEAVELSEEDLSALAQSPLSSPHLIQGEGGRYEFTAERKRLHDEIVYSYLEGVEASGRPTLYLNGGGPGAGKSSMTKGPNAALTKYPGTRPTDDMTGEFLDVKDPGAVLIDPDSVKAQLPEVKEWRARQQEAMRSGAPIPQMESQWAGASHEESSYLSKRIYQASRDRGLDIVYDGTGDGGVRSVLKKVDAARADGYRVEANYLYLEPSEGLQRALARATDTGRNVPLRELSKIYKDLPGTFDAVKEGVFDTVRLFDNNVPRGVPARLVGESTGLNEPFEVLDQGVWGAWLGSADATPVGID